MAVRLIVLLFEISPHFVEMRRVIKLRCHSGSDSPCLPITILLYIFSSPYLNFVRKSKVAHLFQQSPVTSMTASHTHNNFTLWLSNLRYLLFSLLESIQNPIPHLGRCRQRLSFIMVRSDMGSGSNFLSLTSAPHAAGFLWSLANSFHFLRSTSHLPLWLDCLSRDQTLLSSPFILFKLLKIPPKVEQLFK